MQKIELFTDSSVNPQTKVGFAAFLVKNDKDIILESLNKSIKIKKFENTSSTRIELQSLLWAINEIEKEKNDLSNILIEVYTDCQNIVNLKNRKSKLVENDYQSGTRKTPPGNYLGIVVGQERCIGGFVGFVPVRYRKSR